MRTLIEAGRAIKLEIKLADIRERVLTKLRDYDPSKIAHHVKVAELRAGEQYRAWLEQHETERRER